MKAMVLEKAGAPLREAHLPRPVPTRNDVLIEVHACAVCRTDLHVVDGELPDPELPLIPGHEIVGTVIEAGHRADHLQKGMRVGIPWLGWTCGDCGFCRSGAENLCESARFTGYTLNGGYAEYAVADARYCFPLPAAYDHVHAAPLLCAGLIGHRAYRIATERPFAGEAARIGLYGFGAAAHLVAQIAVADGRSVFAFTRRIDDGVEAYVRGLGAAWVGTSSEMPPEPLDAAIIFAPVGSLVPTALRATRPGGAVVCAGIHMSDIPSFPYELLWRERTLRSVANLTRTDAEDFLARAARTPLRVHVTTYPLLQANAALDDLRGGRVRGAAVLVPGV
ncbi:MAG: zinc-dependent alcohol dehydrogenase family protein [Candidatus Krumholzibacteria bacterium]|nr:zinc-dependent alcohol dehydrogenase family protein [Candidatus Krumholzibacteria bacterium]MDH4338395.1 zinc-dependent alcohol dehydrogenase family protein [Candidatus Krumholzibacteria bacterium]MDH5271339.1 zinc-dependent alcohol dehydrogenase family protein [Candidatus Krumholzibacteria bacterium]MDH5628232.1 zinc-dependent alcohol dehydrogenase family protein [Candidatus Krumholzibacteria bacterium]